MSDSAVLEVSAADADASDTSGSLGSSQAELHDLDAAPPLLMEPLRDIAVQVDAPMKQLSTLETYVTYRVRCACARWPAPPYVRRRYNHFKALRQRLVTAYPLLPVPPLPPLHTARQQLDRYAASFVAVRTHALHAFLDRVAKHPILTHSEELRLFLTERDEALERALRPDGGSYGLWGLGGVLASIGGDARAPAPGRVKEPEFGAASDYLQSLQQKLNTLGALTTRLFKDSAALGREMNNMKPVADAWSSHERGALAAAARGAGAGAAGAGAARAALPSTPARALLPQLAAYAAVVRDKILERDALHNTYVSSNNTASETHNRLEQASEALRSELTDWNGKTKADIKAQLLDIAEKQLLISQRALVSWESALQSCKEGPTDSSMSCKEQPTNIEDIFKTVSKTALLNLSPSRIKDVGSVFGDPCTLEDHDLIGEENGLNGLHSDSFVSSSVRSESLSPKENLNASFALDSDTSVLSSERSVLKDDMVVLSPERSILKNLDSDISVLSSERPVLHNLDSETSILSLERSILKNPDSDASVLSSEHSGLKNVTSEMSVLSSERSIMKNLDSETSILSPECSTLKNLNSETSVLSSEGPFLKHLDCEVSILNSERSVLKNLDSESSIPGSERSVLKNLDSEVSVPGSERSVLRNINSDSEGLQINAESKQTEEDILDPLSELAEIDLSKDS